MQNFESLNLDLNSIPKRDDLFAKNGNTEQKDLIWVFLNVTRSIPDPIQLSGNGSRSDQDPKKMECDPDRDLPRSDP